MATGSSGSPSFASPVIKLVVIGLLTLMLVIPLMVLSQLRGERSARAAEVAREVAASWAGEQTIAGPVLLVPYLVQLPPAEGREPRPQRRVAALLPDSLKQTGDLAVEERQRGIYRVPVWRGRFAVEARFAAADLSRLEAGTITPLWGEAAVVFQVSDPRGLEREVTARIGGAEAVLEPGAGPTSLQGPALHARLAGFDGRAPLDVAATFELKGSGGVGIAPLGRSSTVTLTSNWAHPSFFGAFLPSERSIGEAGFSATWSVPHYARPTPQLAFAETPAIQALGQARAGVRFFQPVDIYHQVERALKYGTLIIGAAFVVVFLMETLTARPFHPIQYLMVGAALTVFYLLLLSFAEHIGFAAAYALASLAVAGLVALYVALSFRRLRAGALVGGELLAAYGLLYLVLRSEDYALLAGSVIVFLALAAVMLTTVRIDWSRAAPAPRPEDADAAAS